MEFIGAKKDRPFLLLFIHGFIGGAETWLKSGNKKSILTYLEGDDQIRQQFDIAIYTYDTSIFNGVQLVTNILRFFRLTKSRNRTNWDIETIAGELKSQVEVTAKDYKKIIIVAHSMGGLVSKEYILRDIHNQNPKVGLYISLAVPHGGSDLATIGKIVTRHKQISDLAANNKFLKRINESWLREKSLPKRIYFCGNNDQIVNSVSSIGLEITEPDVIYSSDDHYSILAPSRSNSHVLNRIKNACLEFASDNGGIAEKSIPVEVLPSPPNARFWKLLSFSLILFSVVFLLYIFYFNKKEPSKEGSFSKISTSTNQLIQYALENTKKAYVIPNILMAVNFEQLSDGTREADVTITYNIVYIREPDSNEYFKESYSCVSGDTLTRFAFSDTATETKDKTWNIVFKAKEGQSKVVMSRFKLRFPNDKISNPSNFWGSLGRKQEIFQYSNDEDDILGEIVIVVSSSSLTFSNPVAAQGHLADKIKTDALTYILEIGGHSTSVARFYYLRNDQNAQLRVAW